MFLIVLVVLWFVLLPLSLLLAYRNPRIYTIRIEALSKISTFIRKNEQYVTSDIIDQCFNLLDNPSYSKMVLMIHKTSSYTSFYGDLEERLQNIISQSPSTLNKENTMTNTNSTTVTNTEDTLDFDHSIVEYIRGEKNHPKGMMMAVIDRKTNTIHIGWSLTRSGSKDKFIKDRAYDIAMGRVVLADVHKVTIPFELVDSIGGELPLLEKFVLRSMKYFQVDKVTVFGRVRKEIPDSSQLEYTEFQHS